MSAEPARIVEPAELQQRVVSEVLTLEEPSRQTVLLRSYGGLEADEIARAAHA